MDSVAQLMTLKGRVALVTGGAGYIGGAMVETLAELGAEVMIADIDEDRAQTKAQAIQDQYGVSCQGYGVDLEEETAVRRLPDSADRDFGRLDIIINNAAFVGTSGLKGWAEPFERQTVATWRRALEVNLTSTFNLTQSAAPLLRAHRVGSVINVGSIYGVLGPDLGLYADTAMQNPAAYAASKGGLVQFTRWCATVLAPDIRVNSICPGGVARGQPDAFANRYVARTPLGRMATEQDFKGITAYLASDLSAYVTGQNIMIDGGWGTW